MTRNNSTVKALFINMRRISHVYSVLTWLSSFQVGNNPNAMPNANTMRHRSLISTLVNLTLEQNSVMPGSDFTIYLSLMMIVMSIIVALILAMAWLGDWPCYKFDAAQSSLTPFHVVAIEKNIMEHVVWDVKLGKKIQKNQTC